MRRSRRAPPRPPGKPLTAPSDPTRHPLSGLLPRESVERATRLIATALGRPVAFSGTDTVGPEAKAPAAGRAQAGLQVCIVPVLDAADMLFCDQVDDGVERSRIDAVVYAGARAYAVLPLKRRRRPSGASTLQSPDPSGSHLALCVLSDVLHAWTDTERRSLRDVADALAEELHARQDLAECQLRGEELRQQALCDRLTGLPNRALFLDRLGHAVERARRHRGFRFALLSLDLDRFKAINASLGPDVGDEVLAETAHRLEGCVRGEDMVARLAGDEFAVLIESISDDSDGPRVAERIQRALGPPTPTTQGEVFVSASAGIVLSTGEPHAPPELLQRAGLARSRAEAAGGARYEMYDQASHVRAVARLRMEIDLRRALDRAEFELYYQPLVSLDSGRITELEALLRWRHPERGMILPLDFIPLAEETGLIVPIGHWVLDRACRQMCEWQQRFRRDVDGEPLALSVNLSMKEFAQPNFVQHVAEIVRTTGLDPRTLKLEITESAAIGDAERTRSMLESLRALGVRIYLDDFGTGYSSLAHLHQLPLDAIKIDRSFVTRMDAGFTHMQLVHTVHALARNIGIRTVAEGVETPAQLRTLRQLACESAQGRLFSSPLPAAEIEKLLEADPRW